MSAIGHATLFRQEMPAAPTETPASSESDTPIATPPEAAAGHPAPKPARAQPSVTPQPSPDVPPAPIVALPEATRAILQRPQPAARPVAGPASRPAPDQPEPAEHTSAPAAETPILPQMIPVATPIPEAAPRAVDTPKPTGANRTPAAPAVGAGAAQLATTRDSTVAARDPAPPAAAPEAQSFADALPAAPAPAGDIRAAIAPLLTAEPFRAANAQQVASHGHTADAPHTPVITAQPGQIGRDLGVEIAHRVSAGGNELVVRLAPAELGRIEVRMAFDDRGGLTAVIAADSPVALDMLRRDSADLSRSLSDAGFRSDGQSLRFDGGGDRGGGQPRTPWHNASQKPGQTGDFGPASDLETSPYRPLRTSGRYDLMA